MENFNGLIELFRLRIVDTINNSNLPVGVVYYILKNITKEVEELYQKSSQNDIRDIQQKINSNKKEEIHTGEISYEELEAMKKEKKDNDRES